MRLFLGFILALAGTLPILAQNLIISLLPPRESISPGSSVDFDLVALNPGANEARFMPAAVMNATLVGRDGRSWPAELNAISGGMVAVAPRAFGVSRYRLNVPADAEGPLIVEIAQSKGPPLRGVMDVRRQAITSEGDSAVGKATPGGSSSTEAGPLSRLRVPPTAESALPRTFSGRISPHEPIYFAYGRNAPAAKFQFSFKYRLLSFAERSEDAPEQRSLQFGFTQRSLWNTRAYSSPFYDTSYMPELMFESLAPKPKQEGGFTWIGYQFSLKHESNGQAGSISRSVNRAYFRPAFELGQLDGWHVLVFPEFYAYIGDIFDNPKIKDYRGYGQLRVGIGYKDGPLLMATALAGRKFDHGTVQLDLTVPFHTKMLDFGTYFLVQYFNGYGESIRSYDTASETVRAGISLVR